MRTVVKKSLIVMVSLILLGSCTTRFATNGENLYLQSRNGPNLVIPRPLTDSNISHFYDLPPSNSNAKVSIVPPGD